MSRLEALILLLVTYPLAWAARLLGIVGWAS